MSELTPQQEQAIATFKANMHFPENGFHELILELCKTYQLPFQQVRKVVMSSQKKLEKKIRVQFDTLDSNELTQHAWRESVEAELIEMAKENVPVMTALQGNSHYLKATTALKTTIQSEDEREDILECLFLAYEKEVFKPLLAMLRTTKTYWQLMLADEIGKMTPDYQQKFSDYPQYMEAANHLFQLEAQVKALILE